MQCNYGTFLAIAKYDAHLWLVWHFLPLVYTPVCLFARASNFFLCASLDAAGGGAAAVA
jgi:hypothetical protein